MTDVTPPDSNAADRTPPGYTAVPSASTYADTTGEDPGRTLGIVGLILAIVLPLAGWIISAVANGKSTAAGRSNPIAKAGIIVGAILTILSAIGIILVLALPLLLVSTGAVPAGS